MQILRYIISLAVLLGLARYELRQSWSELTQYHEGAKRALGKNLLFRPKSGREVLPVEAQQAVILIDTLQLKDYAFFGSMAEYKGKYGEVWQRINEAAWPARRRDPSLDQSLFGFVEASPSMTSLMGNIAGGIAANIVGNKDALEAKVVAKNAMFMLKSCLPEV